MNLQEQISRIQSMMGVQPLSELEYDPEKVVFKDDEHIVVDKNMDDQDEFQYDDDDISYENDEWLVIDKDSDETKDKELNESNFFERRVDLDQYKDLLKKGVPYMYYETNSLKEFKNKLLTATLSNYIYYKHDKNIWMELDMDEIDNFVMKLDEVFGDLITGYYEDFKENGRLTKEEMKEGELTEKCWPGYTQKGMKTMFGKRYPNCVKKTK